MLVDGDSTVEVSVVLTTAELIKEPAAVPARIAATIWIEPTLAPDARLPTLKTKSSGFAGVVSDALAGIVIGVPATEALRMRRPSGILSVT